MNIRKEQMLHTFRLWVAGMVMLCLVVPAMGQESEPDSQMTKNEGRILNGADSITDMAADSLDTALEELSAQQDTALVAPVEHGSLQKSLKTKFIEGNAGFMSMVALALVIGLAFCIGNQNEEVSC